MSAVNERVCRCLRQFKQRAAGGFATTPAKHHQNQHLFPLDLVFIQKNPDGETIVDLKMQAAREAA
jgi:hypothetical protein